MEFVRERDGAHFEEYSLTYFFNTTDEKFYKIVLG
jgi:hypothetical protein